MALQSQMLRTPVHTRSAGGMASASRVRAGRKLIGVGLLLAIICGGTYVLLNMRARTTPPADAAGAAGVQPASTQPRPALPGTQHIGPSIDPLQNPTVAAAPAPTTGASTATPGVSPTVLEMSAGRRPGQPAPSSTLIPKAELPSERTQSPLPTTPAPGIAQTQTPSQPAPTPAPPAPTSPSASPLPGTSGAPAAAAPAPSPTPGFGSLPSDLAATLASAERAQAQNKLLDVRTQLNTILLDPRTSARDREGLRTWIARLNNDLVFSPTVFPGDTLSQTYTVVSGDNLARITRKTGAVAEPALLARVNRLANPNALRVGQSLKVVRGPFHAVVSKSAFRMDVYAGPVPSPSSLDTRGLPDGAEPGWTYIASYPVGLGKDSGTPIANFIVKENKLINPTWANPRTGEKFAADDPKNPIGERWIGLAGMDEKSKGFEKYGIHGTIESESIGAEMSMGCVRMRETDVEVVYELLIPKVSVVKIVP